MEEPISFTPDISKGLVTTTRIIQGRAVSLESHLVRLISSVKALYGAVPATVASATLDRAQTAAATADDNQMLRIIARPGIEPVDFSFELSPRLLPKPLRLTTVRFAHWGYTHKAVDRPAFAPGSTLITDQHSVVLEVDNANIFGLWESTLVTPSTQGILPGVARAVVLDSAIELGIQVTTHRAFTVTDFADADAVFASNSVRGIMPVQAIDGINFGDARSVPAFDALLAATNERQWQIEPQRYLELSAPTFGAGQAFTVR